LEKLQAENAAEWDKRERLETQKLSLERENKQLRLMIDDLQEKIELQPLQSVPTTDTDSVQHELFLQNTVHIII